MRTIVADAALAQAFSRQFFAFATDPNRKGLVLLDNIEPIAATCYDSWTGPNIFMHIASAPGRAWLTRSFLHESFAYPFLRLGCTRVTAAVAANNAKARRFALHLGFHEEATLQAACIGSADLKIYAMFRPQCRYIPAA